MLSMNLRGLGAEGGNGGGWEGGGAGRQVQQSGRTVMD